jgi:hypothetical protein
MTRCTGWLLDVCIEDDQAVLWIKTKDGNTLKLIDDYEPCFYIEAKSKKDGIELFQILRDMELKELRWEHKFTSCSLFIFYWSYTYLHFLRKWRNEANITIVNLQIHRWLCNNPYSYSRTSNVTSIFNPDCRYYLYNTDIN